ncbi:MAG: acyl carrier protein [Verrucomicrobia bacterium]|nr:acyl carrier protein [Verrucomicrobiota bacterium]MBV9658365.1 acyl carrier protein [Verrucomicrobiota bacterium]
MAARPLPAPALLEAELVVLVRERLLETPPGFHAESNLYLAGLDSMSIMQLIILVEEEYGVSLPDGALTKDNISTVRQLAQVIRAHAASA